ncbi:hypothetical protein RF11_06759 [Thelohanellus kitauei]|uniref:Uncharacterized protein n=1 Tax=Thelohanellus kitauei TaxID=669202 RepID=A0A0C2MM70_THEKT|nr:hypothetical protein RF11_06759 [Thelohanellus kitauei]
METGVLSPKTSLFNHSDFEIVVDANFSIIIRTSESNKSKIGPPIFISQGDIKNISFNDRRDTLFIEMRDSSSRILVQTKCDSLTLSDGINISNCKTSFYAGNHSDSIYRLDSNFTFFFKYGIEDKFTEQSLRIDPKTEAIDHIQFYLHSLNVTIKHFTHSNTVTYTETFIDTEQYESTTSQVLESYREYPEASNIEHNRNVLVFYSTLTVSVMIIVFTITKAKKKGPKRKDLKGEDIYSDILNDDEICSNDLNYDDLCSND